jgi:hypothetical protein
MLPGSRDRVVLLTWLLEGNSGRSSKVDWVMGKDKTGLKQCLEMLKGRLAKQLENKNRCAIGARGFVRFSF